jgi:hypothetical protein
MSGEASKNVLGGRPAQGEAKSVAEKCRELDVEADNLALYRLNKEHVRLWVKIKPLIQLLEDGDYQKRFNKYATAIMTLAQYMCGVSDQIDQITIEAWGDSGKPYKIIIK